MTIVSHFQAMNLDAGVCQLGTVTGKAAEGGGPPGTCLRDEIPAVAATGPVCV